MNSLCFFSLAALTLGVAFVLAQRVTPVTACVDRSMVYSLLRRAMRLASLPNHLLTLERPSSLFAAVSRWASHVELRATGGAPSQDDPSVGVGARRSDASWHWLARKLRRAFVRTSLKVLRRRVGSSRVLLRTRGIFHGRLPRISVDWTTATFAACHPHAGSRRSLC